MNAFSVGSAKLRGSRPSDLEQCESELDSDSDSDSVYAESLVAIKSRSYWFHANLWWRVGLEGLKGSWMEDHQCQSWFLIYEA